MTWRHSHVNRKQKCTTKHITSAANSSISTVCQQYSVWERLEKTFTLVSWVKICGYSAVTYGSPSGYGKRDMVIPVTPLYLRMCWTAWASDGHSEIHIYFLTKCSKKRELWLMVETSLSNNLAPKTVKRRCNSIIQVVTNTTLKNSLVYYTVYR